jgi:hypothetical protein
MCNKGNFIDDHLYATLYTLEHIYDQKPNS